jgi:Yip1 domain
MPTLGDLVTVVYRPRETMHRILTGRERWGPQVVFLAFMCASVNDFDGRHLDLIFPGLGLSALAIVALGLIAGAAAWVIALFILSWIATVAGRKMGGLASSADVREAMAWGMVPVIWSPIYRIPFAILASRVNVQPDVKLQAILLDFLAQGGCSMVVVYFAFQFAFMVSCLFVASHCVAEAQQFSSSKGFVNVAIAIAMPLVVIAAAVAAQHLH